MLSLTVYAQEDQNANAQLDEQGTIYIIHEIAFDVEGRSLPFALMLRGGFEEGRRLSDRQELEAYIALRRQTLLNQRVLEEVEIEYVLGERGEDGEVPVKLLVSVRDSRNFIILPFPLYSSSDGFSMRLGIYDYNFFGTMGSIMSGFGYGQRGDDRGVDFWIEADISFFAAGLEWNVLSFHYFLYAFGRPAFYQNMTGIAVRLPWRSAPLTVGIRQFFTVNQAPSAESVWIYGRDLSDLYAPYGTTEIFALREIVLLSASGSAAAGISGDLVYTPELAARVNYPFTHENRPLSETHSPSATFSHALDFGRIDWLGNFRSGLSLSLSNAFNWYFNRDDAPFRASVAASAVYHRPITEFLGVSSRLMYRQWWQWSDRMNDGSGGWIPHFNAGDVIRGVLDSNMWRTRDSDIWADRILSLNVDIPIRVLQFHPSRWFNNPRFAFFEVDLHFSPFIDLALISGPYNMLKADPREGSRFAFEDIVATSGFEFIVFSGFFRNLQLRVSAGYNLRNPRGIHRWDELYIGTSFHF